MDERVRNCLFCRIIERKVPAEIILENDNVIAFKDINPQAKEHVLLVPKRHIAYISDINDSDTFNYIFPAINEIVSKLGIKDSGYRIAVNKGPDACQTVFHLHFHILGGEKLSEKMA